MSEIKNRADCTLKQLAEALKLPFAKLRQLLEREKTAGLSFPLSEETRLTPEQVQSIRQQLVVEPASTAEELKRLVLQRKVRSTLSVQRGGSRPKAVSVEIRKKRTYVKPSLSTVTPSQEDLEVESNGVKLEKEEPTIASGSPDKSSEITVPSTHSSSRSELTDKQSAAFETDDELLLEKIAKLETALKTDALKLPIEEESTDKKWSGSEFSEEREGEDSSAEGILDYQTATENLADESVDVGEFRTNARSKIRSGKQAKPKKHGKLDGKFGAHSEISEAHSKGKGRRQSGKAVLQQAFSRPQGPITRDITLTGPITVSQLASKLAIKGADLVRQLMKQGVMATINQTLDMETAQLICEEMGHRVSISQENSLEQFLQINVADEAILEARAPIVTIMGHVDHGKTSLLDFIRSTRVAKKEAGGITQKIGAYHIKTPNGSITFLDTPGHAAFTAMRARGAKLTDLVVLVVAADDGVMPQTVEAIEHAKAAGVPLVVAITKIDKADADAQVIMSALSQHGIISEAWGGSTQFVEVSSKTGAGIDALLEAILLQAELLELKATLTRPATGIVIEASLDRGRGPVASVLVLDGTLRRGDMVLCGQEYGRVRAMRDERGEAVMKAVPAQPVEILGLSGVPLAGDELAVVGDEKKARELALYRQSRMRETRLATHRTVPLDNIFEEAKKTGEKQELNIVLKADSRGMVEAIREALERLPSDEVLLKVISAGVGGITETDASLALASSAIIIGFNVRADASARQLIESERLDLRYYSVIYDLVEEIKSIMSGLLAPELKQTIIGVAEVRSVFRAPKFLSVGGCLVREGIVKRNHRVRILRNHIVIHEGELDSLRRFKDDVQEVRAGTECGIAVKNYHDIREGDQIEVYETVRVTRSIE